jgi:hypothetical protein
VEGKLTARLEAPVGRRTRFLRILDANVQRIFRKLKQFRIGRLQGGQRRGRQEFAITKRAACVRKMAHFKSVNGNSAPDLARGREGNPLFTIPVIFRRLRQSSSSSNL